MKEGNPYSPPAAAGTDASSGRYWRVDGTDVFARNGAMFPKVDLETGEWCGEGSMVFRRSDAVSAGAVLVFVGVVAGFVVAESYLDFGRPVVWIGVWLVAVVWGRAMALRGGASGIRGVWMFAGRGRAGRVRVRKYLRMASLLLMAVGVVGSVLLLNRFERSWWEEYVGWVFWLIPAGLAMIMGVAVWSLADRGRVRIVDGPDGWMRVAGVHPAALERLRELEAEEEPEVAGGGGKRVRTVFYHGFPLRVLAGKRWRNPWVVFNLVLMKVMKSRLLELEVYDFREASAREPGDLCGELRKLVEDWLAAHPGWRVVSAEHLPSPAGFVVVERVVLASPGLEHCLVAAHSWTEQRKGVESTELKFVSRLDGGGALVTADHPELVLPMEDEIRHRASGSPEVVYEAHARWCGEHVLSPAADEEGLRAWLDERREKADALLEEMGYQGGLREVG